MADDFLPNYTGLANEIGTRTGIDPAVVLGIIDLESAGGKRLIGNNIFGISPTRNGRQYVEQYPDVGAASEAFINLMNSPGYASVRAATTPAAQAQALVRSRYNTVNPQWASIVANKATTFGRQLGYQDAAPAQPAAAAAPTAPAPAPAGGTALDRLDQRIDQQAAGPATPPTAAAPGGGSALDRLDRRIDQEAQQRTAADSTTTQKTEQQPSAAPTVNMDEYGRELGPGGFPVGDSPLSPTSQDTAKRVVSDIGSVFSARNDEEMRNALAPKPGTTYGEVLPYARDDKTGEIRWWALPSSIRGMAEGIYDLSQSPPTGGITPSQTATMAMIAAGRGPEAGAKFGTINRTGPAPPLLKNPLAGWGTPESRLPPGDRALGRNETPSYLSPDFRGAPALPLPDRNPLAPSAVGPSEPNPAVPKVGPATPLRVEPGGASPGATGDGPRPGMGATAEEIATRDTAAAANGWRPLRPDETLAPGQEVASGQDGTQWVRQPVPQSAGAAATPADLAGMAPQEAAAAQARAEQYRLSNPRTTVNGHDNTQYVPGVRSTTAEITGNPADASWQKFYANQVETKERFLDQQKASGDTIKEHFLGEEGTGSGDRQILANAETARDAQATRDLTAAFGNKKPTDAQPVVETVQQILADPRNSENTYIGKYIAPIINRLRNADGTLKSDPEVLYGLREDLARGLKKISKAADPNLGHVSGELLQVVRSLDGVIEKGASGYRAYMDNYAAASRQIDRMQVLQDALPQLEIGANKHFTFKSFDRFMKGIVEARRQPGVNPAKSLDPETMDRLWNIYAELHRQQTATDLGTVRGSPTQPWLSQLAQVSGEGLLHAGLIHFDQGGFANMALRGLVGATKNALQSSKTRNEVSRLLNPPNALGPD